MQSKLFSIVDLVSDNEAAPTGGRFVILKVVPEGRIELPTPRFSAACSTTELPRHGYPFYAVFFTAESYRDNPRTARSIAQSLTFDTMLAGASGLFNQLAIGPNKRRRIVEHRPARDNSWPTYRFFGHQIEPGESLISIQLETLISTYIIH